MSAAKKPDKISAPTHYCYHPKGIEQVMISRYLPGLLSHSFKYVWRAGRKGDLVEDLKKSYSFLCFEIENMHQMTARINPYHGSFLYRKIKDINIEEVLFGFEGEQKELIKLFILCGIGSVEYITSVGYMNQCLLPLKEKLEFIINKASS